MSEAPGSQTTTTTSATPEITWSSKVYRAYTWVGPYKWEKDDLPDDGTYHVTATAYDMAGNPFTNNTGITIKLDRQPPDWM